MWIEKSERKKGFNKKKNIADSFINNSTQMQTAHITYTEKR